MKSLDEFFEDLDRPAERDPHPAGLSLETLLAQCVVTKGRSAGPGGQHRNKVSTHVTVTHRPTKLEAQAGERRSAGENQRVALKRLRIELAMKIRVGVPAGEIRSDLWRSRCVDQRIRCSVRHQDFPTLLAEAVDILDASGWDPRVASTRLVCTMSQLIKFIAKHPPAMVMVNNERTARGMKPLKT